MLAVDARFLYGAPASGLNVEGETLLKPVRSLPEFPGYVFGLEDDPFSPSAEALAGGTTDEAGHAVIGVNLPDTSRSSRPLEATINVRVLDTSNRPIERNLTLPVLAERDRLGIKPLFDGSRREQHRRLRADRGRSRRGARGEGRRRLVALQDRDGLPVVPRRRALGL